MAAADVVSDEPPATSSLPPYSDMIMAAIKALNESNGSNKLAISKQIEEIYGGDLPPSHSALVAAHLARMKENGELIMVRNNYLRTGPDAPPRRGRGRPPKHKDRASAAKVADGIRRPRGRPPKNAPSRDAGPSPAAPVAGVKRGRGRPPKVKLPIVVDLDVGFA